VVGVVTPTWPERRSRVATLRERPGPASELLAFYDQVLERQASVCRKAESWLRARPGVLEPRRAGPRLDLVAIGDTPPREAFTRFVDDVAGGATPVLRRVAEQLRPGTGEAAAGVLRAYGAGQPLDETAARLGCDPLALAFFPRAFLQPVAEAALAVVAEVGDDALGDEASASPRCPWCGGLPQVSVLVDEMDTRGRRRLICGICAGRWIYTRSVCPACGETGGAALSQHEGETWPHVRVDACATCRTYLKTCDLRAAGRAVPLVDEIASVELDLWAGEQGLDKLQRNLLGL
jgi:FdhE protein